MTHAPVGTDHQNIDQDKQGEQQPQVTITDEDRHNGRMAAAKFMPLIGRALQTMILECLRLEEDNSKTE
jgi:hypothetical protein